LKDHQSFIGHSIAENRCANLEA